KQNIILLTVAYLFLGVAIAPWIGVLHKKYDKWTIGSSVGINAGVKNDEFIGQPQTYQLLPPPHEKSITAWEDPTLIRYNIDAALSSPEAFIKKIEYIAKRLPHVLSMVNQLSLIV